MKLLDEVRAAPPEAPVPTRALLRAQAEQAEHQRQRAQVERRGMVRGLVVLAAIVLIASMVRAGFGRVFIEGWWRHW